MVSSLLGGIAGGATVAITIKAVDDFSKTFSSATSALTGIGKVGLAAVAAVGTGLALVGKASIKAAGDFEQTQVAFTTMLGSAEKSAALLKELTDFAVRTPFTLQGIEGSSKQLLAMGIESDKLLPTLKALGDVSAGLSVPLDRLALNFGQVKAQGKLTGRELRDFAIAGVPLTAELAKQLGVSEAAISEMVSAGEIGFDKVEQAFISMSSAGGKFENLMAKQAETVQGKFSNLQDTFQLIAREIGATMLPVIAQMADLFLNDLLPAIQPLIPVIGDFLKRALEAIIPFLPKIIEGFMRLVEFSLRLFEAIGPLLEPLMNLAFIIFDAFLKILEPFIPLIEMLAPIFAELLTNLAPIIVPLTELVAELFKLAFVILEPFLPILLPIIDALGWFFDKIASGIDFIKTLVGWIRQLIEFLNKLNFGLLQKAVEVGSKVFSGGRKTSVGDAIISPDGNIITTHPDDYIIATKNPESLNSKGVTIVIENNTFTGLDAREIAMEIENMIKDKIST